MIFGRLCRKNILIHVDGRLSNKNSALDVYAEYANIMTQVEEVEKNKFMRLEKLTGKQDLSHLSFFLSI
jgi:hypothetical protein